MSDGGFLPTQQVEQEVLQPPNEPAKETSEAVGDPELAIHEQERLALEEEAKREEEKHFLKDAAVEAPTSQVVASDQVAPESLPAAEQADEVLSLVKDILEEDLEEYVTKMPEATRERFENKGREIATRISNMVRSGKVQNKRVVLLIREWLLTIPAVNKFFMEQVAKIKTDSVLKFEQEHRKKIQTTV